MPGVASVVSPDSLLNGSNLRDAFSRRVVFATSRLPVMRFQLDSLTHVQQADKLHARAHGAFELRGVRVPAVVPVSAWAEGDALRVVGQTSFSARELVRMYGMSRLALGMAVISGRWKEVHWGLDFVLQRAGS